MINEKNIPLLAVVVPVVSVIIFAVVSISIFNTTQNNLLEEALENTKKREITSHKESVKTKVDETISEITYYKQKGFTTEEIMQAIQDKERIYNASHPSTDYTFIYKIHNLESDSTIHKLVNLNYTAPSLSTDKHPFLIKVLKGLRENGGEFSNIYKFKKPNTEGLVPKISYFAYYPEFQWIVGQGIYLDDVDVVLKEKKESLEANIHNQRMNFLVLVFMALVFILLFSLFFARRVNQIFIDYRNNLNNKHEQLKEINTKLESEVEKKTKQLLHASRSTAMSDIMNMLAHQWRQPLNVISLELSNLEDELEESDLLTPEVNKNINGTQDKLAQLSKTINEFINLFRNDNVKQMSNIRKSIDEVVKILTINDDSVKIYTTNVNDEANIYKHEFQQVVTALLRNSIEAMKSKGVVTPTIKMKSIIEDSTLKLEIIDNGGGIQQDLLESIFEPYSTTKGKNGFALGLYICKELIESRSEGKISIENYHDGVKVDIEIPV